MNEAVNLFNDIRSFLRLSYRLTERPGRALAPGDKFRLKFTVSNQGPPAGEFANPVVIFENAIVVIVATQFATPIAGDLIELPVPDVQLYPGESSSVIVEFKALRSMGGPGDIYSVGPEVRAEAMGDLNLQEFFRCWKNMMADPTRNNRSWGDV